MNMKKYLVAISLGMLLSGCSALQPTPSELGDTSRNSIDWEGTYEGILPCADCSGIKTTLTLKPEEVYEEVVEYIGQPDTQYITEGRFQWDRKGNKVILSNKRKYMVGENQVFLLDSDGNRVTGELANSYRLIKMP